MKIKTVHAHFQIGFDSCNYERIGYSFQLEEGETVESAVSQLRQEAIKIAGPGAHEIYDKRYAARNELGELERKLQAARKNWEATAEFLRAQGLKPDAPSMPLFERLLNPSVNAEIVEEDEEDDYENDDDDDDNY